MRNRKDRKDSKKETKEGRPIREKQNQDATHTKKPRPADLPSRHQIVETTRIKEEKEGGMAKANK